MVFSALVRLDAFVLDATERMCRRWQVLTGRTNIWLAVQLTNLSIVLYFVWAAVEIWTSDGATRVGLGMFCALVLYALTKTVLRVPIESYESGMYLRVRNGHRNPRRVRDVFLRLPFLFLSVLLMYPSVLLYRELGIRPFSYWLILLTTAVLYLLACDPLPPRGSAVWEWAQQLFGGTRRSEARDPAA
jgi:hypothetical protein